MIVARKRRYLPLSGHDHGSGRRGAGDVSLSLALRIVVALADIAMTWKTALPTMSA
jgi:hypothetical protein